MTSKRFLKVRRHNFHFLPPSITWKRTILDQEVGGHIRGISFWVELLDSTQKKGPGFLPPGGNSSSNSQTDFSLKEISLLLKLLFFSSFYLESKINSETCYFIINFILLFLLNNKVPLLKWLLYPLSGAQNSLPSFIAIINKNSFDWLINHHSTTKHLRARPKCDRIVK